MTNHNTPPSGVPEQSHRNAYNPITLQDVRPAQPDPFFRGLDNPSSKIVAGVLFVLIFFLANQSPVATPVVLLILLACLLYRMTPRERAITAAPLTFSAVRLATQLAGPLGIWRYVSSLPAATAGPRFDAAAAWVPVFLAACLFFLPTQRSNTYKVVFWYSLVLLLSGLLPGAGYLVVCAMLFYTLFLALVVTLVIDLNPNLNAARPLAPAPQPARA